MIGAICAALLRQARAFLSLLVPLVLTAVTFLTSLRISDSRWPVLGITLATASAVAGALWYWRRHRRLRPSSRG